MSIMAMNTMAMMLLANSSGTSSASIGTFLQSAQESLAQYGSILTSLIGVAMVIVGIFQVAKNLISHGKGQTNWVVTICLILIGGTLAITGGWRTVGNLVSIGNKSISDMANGSADTSGSVTDPFNK